MKRCLKNAGLSRNRLKGKINAILYNTPIPSPRGNLLKSRDPFW